MTKAVLMITKTHVKDISSRYIFCGHLCECLVVILFDEVKGELNPQNGFLPFQHLEIVEQLYEVFSGYCI